LASGRCLKNDGQSCTAGVECLNGACCSGVCRNLASDVAHCGGCTLSCTNPNGTTTCQGGRCVPACTSGFGDCDGNDNNGCEANLSTSTTSCGACGVACTNAHGGVACSGGACAPTCDAGWGDCDSSRRNGCETDLTSTPLHCGA